MWESTNLSLTEDGQKYIRSVVLGDPWNEEQQPVRSVERRGLDDERDDGPVPSTDSSWTRGSTNVAAVREEPDGDRDGEDDVDRSRKREVGKIEPGNRRVPQAAVRSLDLVDQQQDTRRYIKGISSERRRWLVDSSNTHPRSRST